MPKKTHPTPSREATTATQALHTELLALTTRTVNTGQATPEEALRAALDLGPALLDLFEASGSIAWAVPNVPPAPAPSAPSPTPAKLTRAQVVTLIERQAKAQGVPPTLALAFADIESRLNPDAEGDITWHEREDGARYRKHVLGNKRLASNPALLEAPAWHSYGLFQLLAPWHVDADQHPRSLLNAEVNAQKGVAAIKRALKQAKGDPYGARLAYVGCGVDGSSCDAKTVRDVREKLRKALVKHGA